VFVLMHRPPNANPDPAVTFISGSVSDGVATAKAAAPGKAVIIFGANLAAQCLSAGLLEEIVIHLVPFLLAEGVRLLDVAGLAPVPLERELFATSGHITDLRFAVRHEGEQRGGSP
jgi:dihydrofolate reductase